MLPRTCLLVVLPLRTSLLVVTSWSDITNLNNKIKKYDENPIYYTSLPKTQEILKHLLKQKLSKNP